MTDDEIEALQEELTESRSENERLQSEAAEAQARTKEVASSLTAMRGQLSATEADAEALRTSLREAIEEYRQAALTADPTLPPELVSGETVAEVRQSLETARTTIARVRERMADEDASFRVPPGAPPRRAPDLSALSPRDKIAEGLRQNRG